MHAHTQIKRQIEIIPACNAQIQMLQTIEQRASQRFDVWPDLYAVYSAHTMPTTVAMSLIEQGQLWVASVVNEHIVEAVGFIAVTMVDQYPHIDELDVLPEYGSQGIGSALISFVEQWALSKGHNKITLTTLKNIPWNAPYYQKRGYQLTDPDLCGPEHAKLFNEELSWGLGERVMMAKNLQLLFSNPMNTGVRQITLAAATAFFTQKNQWVLF